MRRGYALVEAITGMALAVALVGTFALAMRTQIAEVRVTSDWLVAREALVDASERLRAGALASPSTGRLLVVSQSERLRLTCRRLETVDPRLTHADLVPVVLRAEWKGPDGTKQHREQTLLVRRRP